MQTTYADPPDDHLTRLAPLGTRTSLDLRRWMRRGLLAVLAVLLAGALRIASQSHGAPQAARPGVVETPVSMEGEAER